MPTLQADLELLIEQSLANIGELDTALQNVSTNFTDAISGSLDALVNGGSLEQLRTALDDTATGFSSSMADALTALAVPEQFAASLTDIATTFTDEMSNSLAGLDTAGLSSSLEGAATQFGDTLDTALSGLAAPEALTTGLDAAATSFADTLDLALSTTNVETLRGALDDAVVQFSDLLDTALASAQTDQLASALDDAATAFGDSLDEAISNVDTSALTDAGSGVGGLNSSIQQTGSSAAATTNSISALAIATTGLKSAAAGAGGEAAGVAEGLGQIGGVSAGAVAGVTAVAAGFALLTKAGEDQVAATQRLDLIFGQFAKDTQHINVGGLTGQLKDLTLQSGSLPSKMDAATAKLGQLAIASGLTQKEAAGVVGQFQALALRAVAINPALGDAGATMDRLTLALSRGGRFAANLGLSLSPAEIKLRALADTGKTTAAELTIFEKATAGAEISVEKLGNTLGTSFQKGTQQTAVQFKQIQASVTDTLETLGAKFVPIALQLAKAFEPVAKALANVIAAVVSGLTPALDALGPILSVAADAANVLADALNFLAPALPVVAAGIGAIIAISVGGSIFGVLADGALALGAALSGLGFESLAGGLLSLAGAAEGGAAGLAGLAAAAPEVVIPVALAAGAIVALVAAFGGFDSDPFTSALADVKQAMSETGVVAEELRGKIFGQVTSFDTLTTALNNLTPSLAAFIEQQSRFKTSNQIDDLKRLGLTFTQVAQDSETGRTGLALFFDTAAAKGEITGNLTKGLVAYEQTQISLTANTDKLTKALLTGNKSLLDNLANSQQLKIAYDDAAKKLKAAGGEAILTGADFAKLTKTQQENALAIIESGGKNADLVTSFLQTQDASAKAEKATFLLTAAQANLPPQVQKIIEAEARAGKTSTDWAEALRLLVSQSQQLTAQLHVMPANVDVLASSFTGLDDALTKAQKNLPTLGVELDNVLKVPGVVTPFGIDPAHIGDITTALNNEGQSIATFFSNIQKIIQPNAFSPEGNPALAEALVQLGPDNLGARAAAQLAADQPVVAAGWEKAMEGLVKGELVAEQILANQQARIAFLAKGIGDAAAEAFAQSRFGKDLGQLTDQQLEVVAAHIAAKEPNTQLGQASSQWLDAVRGQLLLLPPDANKSAEDTVTAFNNGLKDPGTLGETAKAATNIGTTINTAIANGIAHNIGVAAQVRRELADTAGDGSIKDQSATTGQTVAKAIADGIAHNIGVAAEIRRQNEAASADTATAEKAGRAQGTAFAKGHAEGIDAGAASTSAASKRIGEIMLDELPAPALGAVAGLHFGQAFGDGIEGGAPSVLAAAKRIGAIAAANITPEIAGEGFGLHFGSQFAAGIEAAVPDTTAAAQRIGTILATNLPADVLGRQLGLHFGQAFAQGIQAAEPDETAAAKRIGAIMASNLPAPVLGQQFGLHFGQQFAAGIQASAPDAATGVAAVTSGVIGQLPTADIGARFGLHFGEGFGAGAVQGVPSDTGSKMGAAALASTVQAQTAAGFAGLVLGAKFAEGIKSINFAAVGQQAGFDFLVGVIKVQNNVKDVGHAIGAIMEAGVKSGLGISSPSTVMLALGAETVEGFVLGVQGGTPEVATAATKLALAVPAAVSDTAAEVGASGREAATALALGLASVEPAPVVAKLHEVGQTAASSLAAGVAAGADTPAAAAAGAQVTDALVAGISSGTIAVTRAAEDTGALVAPALATGLGSPGRDIGAQTSAALAQGLLSGRDGVVVAAASLADSVPAPLERVSALLADTGAKAAAALATGLQGVSTGPVATALGIVGGAAAEGLALGVEGSASRVTAAGASMANTLVGATSDALGTHSPSLVMFSIGADVGEGFALGLEAQATRVASAAATLANATVVPLQAVAVPVANAAQPPPSTAGLPLPGSGAPGTGGVVVQQLNVLPPTTDPVHNGLLAAQTLSAEMFRLGR